MRRHKSLQYLILAAVLFIGVYAIGRSFASSDGALRQGDKPPAFRLFGLDGQVHELEEYRGRPLVINFWGTFCPPCREEMPIIQRQYERWKDQGLQVIGINLSEDRHRVQNFVRKVGVDFPILLDVDRRTERAYGLRQYPTTYFLDAGGVIRDVMVGPLTEEALAERVKPLLTTDGNKGVGDG